MSYNLNTHTFLNKLYLEGNNPITEDININILSRYDIIYFTKTFTNKIDNLPRHIKAIRFNETMKLNHYHYIPIRYTSKHNEFFIFNHPITNLPPDLELLELSGEFLQSLDYLPNNLKYLILNVYYISQISLDLLPTNLEILILKSNDYIFTNLPNNLQELYLIGRHSGLMNKFPINLKLLLIKSKNKTKESNKLNKLQIIH